MRSQEIRHRSTTAQNLDVLIWRIPQLSRDTAKAEILSITSTNAYGDGDTTYRHRVELVEFV
jgi:hypothetical protein